MSGPVLGSPRAPPGARGLPPGPRGLRPSPPPRWASGGLPFEARGRARGISVSVAVSALELCRAPSAFVSRLQQRAQPHQPISSHKCRTARAASAGRGRARARATRHARSDQPKLGHPLLPWLEFEPQGFEEKFSSNGLGSEKIFFERPRFQENFLRTASVRRKIFFEPRPFAENFLRTPGVRTRARAKGGGGEIALSKIIYFRFVLL